jgi:hypothetical protein
LFQVHWLVRASHAARAYRNVGGNEGVGEDCDLVARFLVERFLADFFAPFFLVDRFLGAFLAPFFLVDRAVDFLAAFRFFAIECGSFHCSARINSHGPSTGALDNRGKTTHPSKDNRGSNTNGWLEPPLSLTIVKRESCVIRAH